MKPLLDLSVGLDRTQSPHQYLLKTNLQPISINPPTEESHVMHYFGNKNLSLVILFL